ncbi:hypothetical protein Droror1_Dr00001429 [Drosera rotundifolia]
MIESVLNSITGERTDLIFPFPFHSFFLRPTTTTTTTQRPPPPLRPTLLTTTTATSLPIFPHRYFSLLSFLHTKFSPNKQPTTTGKHRRPPTSTDDHRPAAAPCPLCDQIHSNPNLRIYPKPKLESMMGEKTGGGVREGEGKAHPFSDRFG